jgi:hypothetical protein
MLNPLFVVLTIPLYEKCSTDADRLFASAIVLGRGVRGPDKTVLNLLYALFVREEETRQLWDASDMFPQSSMRS